MKNSSCVYPYSGALIIAFSMPFHDMLTSCLRIINIIYGSRFAVESGVYDPPGIADHCVFN